MLILRCQKKGTKKMTHQEIENLFNTKVLQKGKLTKITYMKSENGYTKTTTMVVRFINYYNMEIVKQSGKQPTTNSNPNVQVLIPHILTYNVNTGNYLLHCYPMPNIKAKTIYKDPKGQVIDKATYELAVPPKKINPSPVRQIKVQDIISIG